MREQDLRLLMFADNYLPHMGGSRLYYHNLLTAVRRNFPETEVCVLTREHADAQDFDSAQNFRIHRVSFKQWPLRALRLRNFPVYLRLLFKGQQLIRRFRPNLLLCDMPLPCGWVGRVLAQPLGLPQMLSVHDEPVQKDLRFAPALERYILRNCDHVLTSSMWCREKLLEEKVRDENISVIFPGLEKKSVADLDERISTLKQKHALAGKRILLTSARLVPHKGQDKAIEVLEMLAPRFPNLVYVMVGRGADEERLRSLTREKKLDDRVIFAGFVDGGDLAAWMALSDICLLLSRPSPSGKVLEGFGIANIEASAAGKPVIAGRVGGTEYSVKDGVGGFLVDPMKTREIAARAGELLENDSLRQSMGESGRRFVEKSFNLEEQAKEFHSLCLAVSARKEFHALPNLD